MISRDVHASFHLFRVGVVLLIISHTSWALAQDTQSSTSLLHFDNKDHEQQFETLRQCILKRVTDAGWVHTSTQRIPRLNQLTETWCRGAGLHNVCPKRGGARTHRPDLSWYELKVVLFAGSVHRLEVDAGHNLSNGWSVHLFWQRDLSTQKAGKDPIFFFVDFKRFVGKTIEGQIRVGSQYSHFITSTRQKIIRPPDGAEAERARIYASPMSLRDTTLTRWDALLVGVERTINSHSLTACTAPPTGTADFCSKYRPLTPKEEKAALQKARQELGEKQQMVKRNYREMSARLESLMPFKECWK